MFIFLLLAIPEYSHSEILFNGQILQTIKNLQTKSISSQNPNDAEQAALDADSIDFHGDGIPDSTDNCPFKFNPDQYDDDGDGFGTVCDCNYNDSTISPGAPEIPNDGIDQDCGGSDSTTCCMGNRG